MKRTTKRLDETVDDGRELASGELVLVAVFDFDHCAHYALAAPAGWSVAKIREAESVWRSRELELLDAEERKASEAARDAWLARNPNASAPASWTTALWKLYLLDVEVAALPKVRPFPTAEDFVERVLVELHGFKRARLAEVWL